MFRQDIYNDNFLIVKILWQKGESTVDCPWSMVK